MSRSKRKPYITNKQNRKKGVVKKAKRVANKSVRKSKTVANGGEYKKESCSYDISDYSFFSPKEKKAFRK